MTTHPQPLSEINEHPEDFIDPRQVESNSATTQLEYLVAMNTLITSISTRFIEIPPQRMREEIQQTLQRIGEFTRVDRSYALFFYQDEKKVETVIEWCRDQIPPHRQLEGKSVEQLSWFTDALNQEEALLISQIPPEMAENLGCPDHPKSMLVVPMVYGPKRIGWIGLESVREERIWKKELKIKTLSKIVGEIFVQFLTRQRAETELRQQEKIMLQQARHAQMGEMISMIAHQWRQPLSTISTIAGNLILQFDLGDIHQEGNKAHLQKIINHTQFLSQTINDFRNFFSQQKKVASVLLPELFQKSLEIMEKSLDHHQIQVGQQVSIDHPIETYANELMQVFINILKNAQDVFRERQVQEAAIQIRMYEQEEQQIVEIADNAGGIAAENLDNLFLPYFTTKEELNGTGLGLYMSKTIIEEHLQGVLTVKNEGPGAKFTIQLPKAALSSSNSMIPQP